MKKKYIYILVVFGADEITSKQRISQLGLQVPRTLLQQWMMILTP